MKNNFIKSFIFLILALLINLNIVSAIDYSGSGANTSGGGTSGSGSWLLGKGSTGVKITLTNGPRTSTSSSLCSFNVTRTELQEYYNFSNIDSWWSSGNMVNSSYLYSYFNIPYGSNSGNYNNLIWFIKNFSDCKDKTVTNNTYIYIEPFATKSGALYTLHTLLIAGTDKNDGEAARILANAASTGVKVTGGVYNAVSKSCNNTNPDWWWSTSKCGVTNYGGNGFGVVEIKASDVFDIPDPVVPDPDPTKIVITKTDTQGNPIPNVTFKLKYLADGTVKTATTNSSGVAVFNNLTPASGGTSVVYQLTEIVPSSYNSAESILYYTDYGGGTRAPDSITATTVTWNLYEVAVNRIFTITNEKNCISEFNAIDKNNLSERLRLYNTYKSEDNHNLNNLLNLNITDASTACNYTACNQSLSSGCLALSNSQTSENDFSCYDFNVSISGSTASVYCFSNFSLQNLFSGSPSKGTYQFGANYDIFAGRLINQNKDIAEAAALSLDIYCYSTTDVGNSLTINKKYSDFISEVTLKGAVLDYVNTNNQNINLSSSIVLTQKESKYGGYLYSLNSNANFNFKKVYSHLLNGKIKYNLTSNLDDYNYLGYGIVSNLDDESGKSIGIEYTVKLGSAITGKDVYTEDSNSSDGTTYVNNIYTNSNKCTYKVTNEITTTDDPDNPDELNLEFRLIDGTVSDSSQSSTINLFPGKNGTGRTIGSNWCKENITDCASNNNLTYDEINMDPVINGINSYGVKPSDGSTYKAKYTIELDASTIQKIRNYNDSVSYDEYDLTCDSKGNCEKSKFLLDTSIWNSDNLEIIEDESARRR